jgi:hypothetical protein
MLLHVKTLSCGGWGEVGVEGGEVWGRFLWTGPGNLYFIMTSCPNHTISQRKPRYGIAYHGTWPSRIDREEQSNTLLPINTTAKYISQNMAIERVRRTRDNAMGENLIASSEYPPPKSQSYPKTPGPLFL